MVGPRISPERRRNSFSLSDIEWRPFSPNASDDTDRKTCCLRLAGRFYIFCITKGHGKRFLLWRSCETMLMTCYSCLRIFILQFGRHFLDPTFSTEIDWEGRTQHFTTLLLLSCANEFLFLGVKKGCCSRSAICHHFAETWRHNTRHCGWLHHTSLQTRELNLITDKIRGGQFVV